MQTEVPVNPIFLDNMKPLWRHDAKLAQRVDDLPVEATLEVQPSKAGPMTARVQTPDGRRLYLHSRHDPEREARTFCENLEKSDALCIVLCGLGLGYHVRALFEVFGDGILILVVEPDLITVKTALEHTDLSKELATGRVEILTSLSKSLLHERLSRHSTVLMLGTAFAVPPVARDYQADAHAACRQAILDYAAFAKTSLVTLIHNAVITCKNIANNLPTYLSTPAADILRRRFAGCPAVLVAAGPSLAKNIEQLEPLQDKAVLISSQTTLRPLLERGIKPHFVTSLDFSEMSRQFFEDADIPGDLVLVAEPKASWRVIDTYRGTPAMAGRPVILLDNEFAHRCVGESLAKRTPMEAGATVMHLAFYLAQWLGCDPIIFVGQDLGFSGHCYYTPGVAMHRAWRSELGRYCTLEMKEWERIARHRGILRKVEDIEGRPIYTDEQMFTYREQFERDFAKCPAQIIDATEGGVRKSGVRVMTLQEAARQFCGEPIDRSRFAFPGVGSVKPDGGTWYSDSKLEPARATLASRREELETFRSLCVETRTLLDTLGDLVDHPKEFNRRIVRIDELRTLVQEHTILFQMVRDVSALGELKKFAADRRMASEAAKGPRRAEAQLSRDRHFVDALLEGCNQLEQILDDALERFDKAIEATT